MNRAAHGLELPCWQGKGMGVSSGVSCSLTFQLGKDALYSWDREPW